jgi:CheY-like chemotaxis protein
MPGNLDLPDFLEVGQGLVGQCAREKRRILLSDVPSGYMSIHSSLGASPPASVVVLPVLFEGQTKAVIELASLHKFSEAHLSFLEQLTESIGVVLNTIEATMRTEGLLQQSQQLTVELQTGQKELQQTNEELEQKARQLAEQNAEVERKNMEIEQARSALEEKAAELALTSKYKSEFLANMSHELRTPLNSILILGQQLSENTDGNLHPKQVEFARNIHSAGSDLLNLINDILDLSKIESGTVTVEAEEINFASLRESVERSFRHVAESKSLPFIVDFDPDLPKSLTSDFKRLQQIIKNLLSNAFKFTARGRVCMDVRLATTGWNAEHPSLNRADAVVALAIIDTGIGIAPEKQRLIFEAFQQADAGTSRKYGGTGLGLAISRELASLLGGEIRLKSKPGEGSTFTLFLPLNYTGPAVSTTAPVSIPTAQGATLALPVLPSLREERVPDDRDKISDDEPSALIVEDDPHYARILLGLARDKGFRGLVATRGHEAISLARQYRPTLITLDIILPDMLGWTVLNNLKLAPETRHIPVQIITVEDEPRHGLSHGAFSYLVKPATTEHLESAFDRMKAFVAPRTKQLLVVEDDEIERQSIVELLEYDDIEITTAATGREAYALLLDRAFDCCLLDLRLPDMSGLELLDKLQTEQSFRDIPVVVLTGKELTDLEQEKLRTAAKSVVLKNVQSPERLLDQTSLFLHRVIENLPESKQRMLRKLHESNEALRGRKVLIVDNDARNIFALSIVLETRDMTVVSATNGRQAVEIIKKTPDLSIILMDIMMPGMDGYQTMREIRSLPELQDLPILALTAKAMKGDREKCLEAGASDYIAKPVDSAQLLSLMRVWLHR